MLGNLAIRGIIREHFIHLKSWFIRISDVFFLHINIAV